MPRLLARGTPQSSVPPWDSVLLCSVLFWALFWLYIISFGSVVAFILLWLKEVSVIVIGLLKFSFYSIWFKETSVIVFGLMKCSFYSTWSKEVFVLFLMA